MTGGSANDGGPRVLFVQSGSRIRLVRTERIMWIEAVGHYVRLQTSDGPLLHRTTLKSVASLLQEDFIQSHRSYVVRAGAIVELHPRPGGNGGWELVLSDGSELPIGRSYLMSLRHAVGL